MQHSEDSFKALKSRSRRSTSNAVSSRASRSWPRRWRKRGGCARLRWTSLPPCVLLDPRRVFEALHAARAALIWLSSIRTLHSNPVYGRAFTVPCMRARRIWIGGLLAKRAVHGGDLSIEAFNPSVGELQSDDTCWAREGGGTPGKRLFVSPEYRNSASEASDRCLGPKYMATRLLDRVLLGAIRRSTRGVVEGTGCATLNIGSNAISLSVAQCKREGRS